MQDDNRDLGGKFRIGDKTYAIYGGLNTIGRNREAVVNIKNLGISQHHAVFILVDDDLHFISDLKSSNGTFLNGKKLLPLQLYQLENDSLVKFADIEGIYTKCIAGDADNACITNFENTQDLTQSFYGRDTQSMDESQFKRPHNKTASLSTQKVHYIPTQVLLNAASAWETTYEKLHEQPTQLIEVGCEADSNEDKSRQSPPSDVGGDEPKGISSVENKPSTSWQGNSDVNLVGAKVSGVDQSVIDLHEAETQKIINDDLMNCGPVNESESSEAVTQIFPQNEPNSINDSKDKISAEESTNHSVTSLEEDLRMERCIDEIERIVPPIESSNLRKNSQQTVLDSHTPGSDNLKPIGLASNVFKDSEMSCNSQGNDSLDDIINPIGLTKNVLNDSEISNEITCNPPSCDEDSSLVKDIQGGNSSEVNPFILPKTSVVDIPSEVKLDESECKPIMNGDSSFSTSHGSFSNLAVSIGVEWDESSNDSVDFMTMQKITDTGYKMQSTSLELDDKLNDDASVENTEKKMEYELNVNKYDENNVRKDSSDSETDMSDAEQNKQTTSKMSLLKKVPSRTEAKMIIDSDSDSDVEAGKSRKTTKLTKKKNMQKMFDSESETDIEMEVHKKDIDLDSGSDTDIEMNIDGDTRQKLDVNSKTARNNETKLFDSPTSNDDSLCQGGLAEIEETKLGDLSVFDTETKNAKSDINDTFNDSDIIVATQECFNIPNSKFENSEESFKLGLTQMMEDEVKNQTEPNGDDVDQINKEKHSVTDETSRNNSEEMMLRIKMPVNVKNTQPVDDEDIYQACTQKICGNTQDSSQVPKDDFIFIQPTQRIPMEKDKFKEKSTQNLDDIYLQPTQEFPKDEDTLSEVKIPSQISEDSEKKDESDEISSEKKDESDEISNDDEDMFATQAVIPQNLSNKALESELEHMFATQKTRTSDESLDKIKHILLQKQVVDCKLPEENSDLEAILATQRIIDSPKAVSSGKTGNVEVTLGHSIESQLEVLFDSQKVNLPPDKFVRPENPLSNILKQESQEINEVHLEPSTDIDHTRLRVSEYNGKNQTNGLEQSFALLEAKSTKIRRSARNKTCEEITVKCPKSRISMTITSNNKIEDKKSVLQDKSKVTTRKRNPSISTSETLSTESKKSKDGPRGKKKKTDDSSEEDIEPVVVDRGTRSSKETESKKSKEVPSGKKKRTYDSSKEDIEPVVVDRGSSKEPQDSSKKEILKPSRKTRQQDTKVVGSTTTKNNIPEEFPHKRRRIISSIILEEDGTESDSSSSTRSSRKKPASECTDVDRQTCGVDCDKKVEDRVFHKKFDIVKKSSSSIESGKTKFQEVQSVETELSTKTSSEKKQTETNSDTSQAKRKGSNKHSKTEDNEVKANSENQVDKNVTEATTRDRSSRVRIPSEKMKERSCSPSGKDRLSNLNTKRKSKIAVTTPSKVKKIMEDVEPSTSRTRIASPETPSKSRRKQKHRVVFTMMESPQLESAIKRLGGSVVDSVEDCTVLITGAVKRTQKLLSAVGLGKPICSEKWIENSKRENEFSDPWDYLLIDKEAEKKWNFSLQTSLLRSSKSKLFEGYTFQLLVSTALDVLRGAIESCGGKVVARAPKDIKNFAVIASPDHKEKYKKLLKQNPNLKIVEPEAIFDGVLRQEIRFERHLLK